MDGEQANLDKVLFDALVDAFDQWA